MEKNLSPTDRARLQTIEEWREEYRTGKPVYPAAANNSPLVTIAEKETNLYIYSSHRTTRLGRLALCFMNIETGEEAVMWFNVDTYGKRGKRKGKQYRIGEGGQFIPKPRSKFRNFWLEVVGKEPFRWANSHRELKPRLKGLNFMCDTKTSYDSDGKAYMAIKNINLVGTKKAQKEHNFGTKKAQEMCTRDSVNLTADKAYTDFKVPSSESALKPSYPRTQTPS